MSKQERKVCWILNALLCASLAACGDDDGDGDTVADAGTQMDASLSDASATPDASKPDSGTVSGECADAVYDELDDECTACVCTTNAEAAPTCDGPCWEFLACSMAANRTQCADFPLGSAENSGCIATACGKELATEGAGVKANAYSMSGITRACLPIVAGSTAACSATVTKIRPAL